MGEKFCIIKVGHQNMSTRTSKYDLDFDELTFPLTALHHNRAKTLKMVKTLEIFSAL